MGGYKKTSLIENNKPVYEMPYTAVLSFFLFEDSEGYWRIDDKPSDTHSAAYHARPKLRWVFYPPSTGWDYCPDWGCIRPSGAWREDETLMLRVGDLGRLIIFTFIRFRIYSLRLLPFR